MKLGIFTAAFPGKSLEEVASWAAENGFETLELACWPVEKATRRYAGVTTVDVTDFDAAKAKEVHAVLNNYGLEISSLGYYPNPLHPDPEHREVVIGHLKKVIQAAELLEVPVVGTFVGRDKDKNVPDNFEAFSTIGGTKPRHYVKLTPSILYWFYHISNMAYSMIEYSERQEIILPS